MPVVGQKRDVDEEGPAFVDKSPQLSEAGTLFNLLWKYFWPVDGFSSILSMSNELSDIVRRLSDDHWDLSVLPSVLLLKLLLIPVPLSTSAD